MNLLLALLATLAAANPAPTPTSNTFVNGRISRSLSGSVEIYEPWLQVNQWVNPWAGGASVSGTPIMGNVSKFGNSLHFFGNGLNGDATEFAGSWRVNATVQRPGQPARTLWFTMQAVGSTNDPNNPPSFNVWDASANLRLNPAGNRDYNLSGWVDASRFCAEGVALVGIIASLALDQRAPTPENAPSTAPDRIYRVLPFPALPIKPQ